MTEKMSDKEIKHLKKEIIKLTYKYMKHIVPKNIRKENGRYNVKIVCPYCNKEVTYGNLVLNNPLFFRLFVCCRNCYMRFCLTSFLFKVFYKYYYELSFIKGVYLKLKNNYWRSK
jgi:superfamily II helicase